MCFSKTTRHQKNSQDKFMTTFRICRNRVLCLTLLDLNFSFAIVSTSSARSRKAFFRGTIKNQIACWLVLMLFLSIRGLKAHFQFIPFQSPSDGTSIQKGLERLSENLNRTSRGNQHGCGSLTPKRHHVTKTEMTTQFLFLLPPQARPLLSKRVRGEVGWSVVSSPVSG